MKNISGNGSDYTVTVDVTKAFGSAKVTVDKPSFTLNDEQLLNVTLNAPKTATKAGAEILGYIHITTVKQIYHCHSQQIFTEGSNCSISQNMNNRNRSFI